ncbi:ABC transporter ATP-binding protein [Paenibacillus sp. N1-5-1-14]|uniref:ABC transporter ATP-binding protein n=1 Tax=Paenibacillus radicibacter TaxID=2972488 RepID=UPI002158FBFC|nr:ABC transporter ATP-binding protein [Paenibacillus radicibacter]MCR8643975.1 ABC transporter ATP-binding protein [Paenibacillus radicibacter]
MKSVHIYEIDHVSKIYKRGKVKANDDIHFHVNEGEILGLLGPNGAGKSTLINQMVGHLSPTEGKILFRGKDVLKQSKFVAQNVAFYAQDPHALVSLKVWEVLFYTGRLRGMNKQDAMRETEKLLARFEMEEHRNKMLKRISGGQKRMIGIGTTLIGNSSVMIFDEPTNELDPKKRRLVWDLIQEKNRDGTTIILVTHNVLEAEQVVDRVAVINHGKLLAIDHVSNLKQKVDQRLKFEITVTSGIVDEMCHHLEAYGDLERNGDNRLRLLVEKKDASRVLDWIIADHHGFQIDEYAIVPPSLEDVYFHIDKEAEQNALTLKEAATA